MQFELGERHFSMGRLTFTRRRRLARARSPLLSAASSFWHGKIGLAGLIQDPTSRRWIGKQLDTMAPQHRDNPLLRGRNRRWQAVRIPFPPAPCARRKASLERELALCETRHSASSFELATGAQWASGSFHLGRLV